MTNSMALDPSMGGDWNGVGSMDRMALYEQVVKALQADGNVPRTGPGISAAQVEDLSGTLASAEIKERSLHFWAKVAKKPAISLNAEWVRLDSYGDEGETGFIGGADAGFVSDPRFSRGTKDIKYMGVKGLVDRPTQLVELVGFGGRGVNAMATAQTARMRQLLRLIERALFHGNSGVSDLEIDGVFSQIDAVATEDNQCRYDLRGAPLDKYVLEHMSQINANNNADLSDFYVPNEGLMDLNMSLFPQTRSGENVPEASIGTNFWRFIIMTLGGNPDTAQIRRTQMLTKGVKGALPLKLPTTPGANAPAMPDAVTGTNVSITASDSHPGLAAGTYYYSVTAVGKGGRSLGRAISSAPTAAAGEGIRLTIVGNDADIEFYEIFRNEEGVSGVAATNRKYMARIPKTAATTQWTDDGYFLPNTYEVAALSFDDDEIYIKQLLAPTKIMLPQDLQANSFGIITYFALVMEIAEHNIHVANVGKRLQSGVPSSTTGVVGA